MLLCYVPSETTAAVKQTAALCLLKLLRVDPTAISIDKHAPRLIRFLNEKNLVQLNNAYMAFKIVIDGAN